MVWPQEQSISDFDGPWWVAHTKSRNEKALAWQLVNHVPYFLPMHWKASKSRGRTIRSLLPLFPGYLFFCGGDNERLAVLKTNRTANILPVENQTQLVRELLPIETLLRLEKTGFTAPVSRSRAKVPCHRRTPDGNRRHRCPNPERNTVDHAGGHARPGRQR